VPGPIRVSEDYEKVKPESEAYGRYADAHVRELINRYKPALLWNDIDYPKSGHPLQLMAEYYAAVPDGVIDNRFGVKHADFTTPEYETLGKINPKKWEECRGLGRSFGYNRAEGEAETIAPAELIHLLVDIVSKNGNLLLDIGPEADGTIPAVQLERLKILGKWMAQNGEAIYGTRPWNRAEGETKEGIPVRLPQKGRMCMRCSWASRNRPRLRSSPFGPRRARRSTCSATTGHLLGRSREKTSRLSCPLHWQVSTRRHCVLWMGERNDRPIAQGASLCKG